MRRDMPRIWFKPALALVLLLVAAPLSARAEKVLRVVPHADLKIVDPYSTTATITLMHGQMIYDQLFGWNSKLEPKPQMVDHYEISPDKLVYTFTLRPGLKFHDGQPVTTRDVIASLKRWMVRDVLGQAMTPFVEEFKAVDDHTFVLRLKEPFAFVETAFAISAGTAPVILREKDALTDPFKNITETIGSGPFKFVAAEWNPGAMTFTRRIRITCRARTRRTAMRAPRSPRSIGSSGSFCPIRSPSRARYSAARSTSSTNCQTTRSASSKNPRTSSSTAPPSLPRSAISGRTTFTHPSTMRRRDRRSRWRSIRRNISAPRSATSAGGGSAFRFLSAAARTRPNPDRSPIRSRIWRVPRHC